MNWIVLVCIPLLILYVVVLIHVILGFVQIMRCISKNAQEKLDSKIDPTTLEGVTILRPLKGIESEMTKCLESSFLQNYPTDKLEIIFCVQSKNDPCIPIVETLISKYPYVDSKLLIDENQNNLDYFGPNPKVNNLHKGYKSGKFDIMWIMDSNVYADRNTLQRSIYSLQNNLNNGSNVLPFHNKKVKTITHIPIVKCQSKHMINWGARLDEMFMSTSHAKFYVALNTIQPAPCINGKSNIFRRSDLDYSVAKLNNIVVNKGEGLSHFAKYIGEDNMIGIALWDGVDGCSGMSCDIVIQPIEGQNKVRDYMDRRVRWLRVRKYMVMAATLIEPTTESLVSGLIGSIAINAILMNGELKPLWVYFFFHMMIWYLIDWIQYHRLQSFNNSSKDHKKFFMLWLLREILALPVWIIAMCGSGIEWRGQPFIILPDLSAEAVVSE